MASSGQKSFGLKGFAVKRRRSRRGTPRYPVLKRLKTGMQTDSDDEEMPQTPHRCHMGLLRRWALCRKATLQWDIKWYTFDFPRFSGEPGEDPLRHSLDLWDAVVVRKPAWVGMEAAWLMAFPFTLDGQAETWFKELKRRKYMTWTQMMDHFRKKFAVKSDASSSKLDLL